ncbi:hypothetical protein BDB01DRAFT_830636 [Pilobolus umbonatus]|nr:hypothetical protein BDB01DRAFT_830636 [Pilobolus umbonatus]
MYLEMIIAHRIVLVYKYIQKEMIPYTIHQSTPIISPAVCAHCWMLLILFDYVWIRKMINIDILVISSTLPYIFINLLCVNFYILTLIEYSATLQHALVYTSRYRVTRHLMILKYRYIRCIEWISSESMDRVDAVDI